MIKALMKGRNGRTVVLMGLDSENVERIKNGQPIRFDGNAVGIQGRTLAICYGDTAEDIVAEMSAAGGVENLFTVPADTTPPLRPGTTPHQPEPIDVRRIVLDLVDGNDISRSAYLNDPAMKYGIEVIIGALGRVAETLTATNRHTRPGIEAIIHDVAVSLAHAADAPRDEIGPDRLVTTGPEDLTRIAEANTAMYGRNLDTARVYLGVMDPTFVDKSQPSGITPDGLAALTSGLAAAGYEILDGPDACPIPA